MSVGQMIALLSSYPLDMKVVMYNVQAEDAGLVNSVEVVNEETHPYCKADTIFQMYPERVVGKEILLIKS